MSLAAVPDGPMTPDEARSLFDEIRSDLNSAWINLTIAHDREAWRVAGYKSFLECVRSEFSMSRGHAYRLLDQGKVVGELTAAAGVSPDGDTLNLTEAATRDLKPHLEAVAERVREATVDTDDDLKAEAAQAAIEEVRAEIREHGEPVSPTRSDDFPRKPDLGGGVSHPARFSDELLPVFVELLDGCNTVLDPFAGTGKIHELRGHGFSTFGVEIEPEWAAMSPYTQLGSVLDLPFVTGDFDAICTSPTYGNRLADHHDASDPERRRSYTHDLGRTLADDNSGDMHWGDEYRAFHAKAWAETVRVLKPGGTFVLNIKDHIRGGEWQDVAAWHIACITDDLGLSIVAVRPVVTRHLRQGANATARVPAELVIAFRNVR